MYLYFYVGNFSQSATEQTAGLNSELFNGKADVNLLNVANTSGFRRLIEISNPNILPSWYKVFAEYDPTTGEFIGNWCEQGGLINIAQNPTALNFLKPFKDTNYSFYLTVVGDNSSKSLAVDKVNTYYANLYSWYQISASPSANNIWKAEGYI